MTTKHISYAHGFAADMARDLQRDFTVEARFSCSWLVERTSLVGDDEYGYEPWTRVEECGAPALGFSWGWVCEAGHDHKTYGGIAHTEYADDEHELRRLGGMGVRVEVA